MVERPHISYPFQRDSLTGKVQVVEQDTPEHIESCVGVIVACPAGFRVDRPEFGWPFPTFRAQPFDLTGLEGAIQTFEPRCQAKATDVLDDARAAVERLETGEALVEVDLSIPTGSGAGNA